MINEERKHEIHARKQPLRVYIGSIVFLIAIAAGTMYVARTHKKPGQMTLIESQAMDMTVMKAPTGSVPVSLETAQPGLSGASVTYSGSVIPYAEQEVFPRVEGWISEMSVYPGDTVTKGQLLAQLVSQDTTQRSAAAGADAEAASSAAEGADQELSRMRQMVKSAQAALDSAKAETVFRDSELARMEKLFESGAISRSELEQERAMNASAHAEQDKMDADAKAARSGVEVARKERESMRSMARAGSSRAAAERTTAGYLELRSLVDGVVTERMVSPGSLARPGAAVLRVAEIGRVRLQANVSQSDAARISRGNPVEVTTPRQPGKTFRTTVSSVFPASDPTTRTVAVEAVIDNRDRAFLPGDFISIRIGAETGGDVISVPDQAVMYWGNGGKPYVWTAVGGGVGGKTIYTCVMHPEVQMEKPGKCPKCGMKLVPKETGGKLKAHRVMVSVGQTSDTRTEILSGLRPGDRVVVEGGGDLNEGDTLFETEWTADGPKELPPAPAMEGGGNMPGMDMSGSKKGGNMENMPGMDMKSGGHDMKVQTDKHDMGDMKGMEMPGMTNKKPAAEKLEKDVIYTCPMHPDVKSDKPGDCPKCGMALERVKKETH
jgi:multidrug efflux pump subunit AcrA (membrane-fusion protein)